MKSFARWALSLMLFCFPVSCWSCEPIIPLSQLLMGSSVAGIGFWAQTLVWLSVAVVIKCVLFAFFERRLTWPRATFAMFIANIVSTIPAALIAVFAGALTGIFLAVPLVFLLGCSAGRRISIAFATEDNRMPVAAVAALGFLVVFFISVWTFAIAEQALADRSYSEYWALKFLFVTLAASTGIVISVVLEEYAIGKFSQHKHGEITFFRPVVRANYITLGLVLLVAALQMLPRRLDAPNFIVSWLQSVLGMFA